MNALSRNPATEEWLSIGEASSLVGVSVATLRRWSDAGEVRIFTTRGGHRRFARSAVLALAAREGPRRPRVSCNGETQIRLARTYRREMRNWPELASTLSKVPEIQRQALRGEGLRMVAALLDHLDAPAQDAQRHLGAAQQTAAECGRLAASAGMMLDDTLALLVRFRAPFIHQLAVVLRGQALDATEATTVLEAASSAFDQLLPAAMAGYRGVPPQT